MPNRKIKIAIGFSVLAFVILGYNIIARISHNQLNEDKIKIIPAFKFQTLDGHFIYPFDINDKGIIIIYFNSECEHCIDLAKEINAYSINLSKIRILMVSSENLSTLNDFKSKLKIRDNYITVCRCEDNEFTSYFGDKLSYPTIFIYDSNKKLVKKKEGSFKTNEIFSIINNQN